MVYRARTISWTNSALVRVPATTIRPSAWIVTPTAWIEPSPKLVRTEPLVPKWVSTVPSALKRVRAKSPMMVPFAAKTEAVPSSTILPSGWIASPAATSLDGARHVGDHLAFDAETPVEATAGRVSGHAEPRDGPAAERE